jgi:hypothetical protein
LSLDHKKEIYTSKPRGGPIDQLKVSQKQAKWVKFGALMGFSPLVKKTLKWLQKGLNLTFTSSQGSSQGRFFKDRLLVSD